MCVSLWHPAAVPVPCHGLSGPSVGVGKASAATSAHWIYPFPGHRWWRGTSCIDCTWMYVHMHIKLSLKGHVGTLKDVIFFAETGTADVVNCFFCEMFLILYNEYLKQHFLIHSCTPTHRHMVLYCNWTLSTTSILWSSINHCSISFTEKHCTCHQTKCMHFKRAYIDIPWLP